jgi:hypothetical protein
MPSASFPTTANPSERQPDKAILAGMFIRAGYLLPLPTFSSAFAFASAFF